MEQRIVTFRRRTARPLLDETITNDDRNGRQKSFVPRCLGQGFIPAQGAVERVGLELCGPLSAKS